jgi:DNA-binding transcriptional LysR family regulator
MRDTDWDDLRYFLSVDRAGSIAAAAKYLGTNHSTVLRRIASLEKQLGARLFERLPTGYAMTTAGEQLRVRLDGVAERIEGAQRELAGLDTRPSGTLRLTTTDTLVHGLLMPHLAAFRRAHPEVRLELVVNNEFLSLTKREADVAIRPTNKPPESLVGRKVGRIRTALYGARSRSRDQRRKPEDLDWVLPDESLAHLAQAKWAAKHVPPERVTVTCDSLLGIADAVAAGLGVGFLPTFLANRRAELVQLAEPDDALDTGLWVLTHTDLRQVPRVRLFMDFVHERLRAASELGGAASVRGGRPSNTRQSLA